MSMTRTDPGAKNPIGMKRTEPGFKGIHATKLGFVDEIRKLGKFKSLEWTLAATADKKISKAVRVVPKPKFFVLKDPADGKAWVSEKLVKGHKLLGARQDMQGSEALRDSVNKGKI
jgi:hypothetical protein